MNACEGSSQERNQMAQVECLDMAPPRVAMEINEFQTCFQAPQVIIIGPKASKNIKNLRSNQQYPDTCEKTVFAQPLTRPDSD